MSDTASELTGQIGSELSLEAMAARLLGVGVKVEVRESGQYEGGMYIAVYEGAHVILERVSSSEYLIQGDAGSVERMHEAGSSLSEKLVQLDLRHRFEVYDGKHCLRHIIHHRWFEPAHEDKECES